MPWRKLSSVVALVLCLGCSATPPQQSTDVKEYDVSGLIDAYTLAQVADSFQVPHAVFYGIAWQETRGGSFTYTFPRGPGILINSKRVCREIGRTQLSPCVNWSSILKEIGRASCRKLGYRWVIA